MNYLNLIKIAVNALLRNKMRAFLTNPVNISYLETAKKLSEMDVAKLRQVAEDILEITY